jgi:RNA polymerase-binding transcription factor DksA
MDLDAVRRELEARRAGASERVAGLAKPPELERTDRALAKLDEGTYGICDNCGQPIPERRLEAMPDSVLCVACAANEAPLPPPRRR